MTIATPPRPRWTFSLRTMFLAFIAIGIGSCAATKIYSFRERLASEYNTARVIREVGIFVTTNGGQWPKSWADLPNGEHMKRYVRLRFDVDSAELVENPELIYTVITPMSGKYRTYPHAHEDLEQLREILARQRILARNRAIFLEQRAADLAK